MPMSNGFSERLLPVLPEIVKEYGTPFHIYDEEGIVLNGENLKRTFAMFPGFQEFFAVKACPNPSILKLMLDMGFGFDCSSIPELKMCQKIGAKGEQIMFTSNNTSAAEFKVAAEMGCILNLDDISFIPKVESFPELICLRYNPGLARDGGLFIGDPVEAKYGIREDQIVEAYRLAQERGATRFGLHTMMCSNQLNFHYIAGTVRMLLNVVSKVERKLKIQFEFINIGGGIGIPYKHEEMFFDLRTFAAVSEHVLDSFQKEFGYAPKLFMECGRYMTGPYGVLVTKVINKMLKYRDYVGVDASMSALMRPALYGAYHHITVLGGENRISEIVDVVGSLCENNDKFAILRKLPYTTEGDILIIHDSGAHGYAMGFNYNGRLRPKELLLKTSGEVKLIRRAERCDDYFATLQI